jgi:hypothetical protein
VAIPKSFYFYLCLILSQLEGLEHVSRPEMRFAYQYFDTGCFNRLALMRFDETLFFANESLLLLRLDVPFLWFRCRQDTLVEVDAEGIVDIGEGDVPLMRVSQNVKEHGLGDILTKAFYANFWDHFGFGFGSDFFFPTAQAKEIGTGKYQAIPTVEFRYNHSTTKFPKWLVFLTKFQFSFAGQSKRPDIAIWFFQPKAELFFPHQWTFSFDSEMQLNWNEKKWFIPLDFNVTKGFSKHLFFSLDYKMGIVRDFPVFKQAVELAGSYTF